MKERQTCVDCRELSPETETNYTLISARFRWRLTRTKDADGKLHVEWRCPSCWLVYKAKRDARGAPPQSTRTVPTVPPPRSGTQLAAPAATNDDDPTLRDDQPAPPPSPRGS